MKITAMMLADHATVREGLLHVLGAGITRVARDPLPARLDVVLALMLKADDLRDLESGHSLEVSIAPEAPDDSAGIAKAVMELSAPHGIMNPGPNLQLPLVVPIQAVPIPRTGTYRLTVTLDGAFVDSYDFEVVKPSQP